MDMNEFYCEAPDFLLHVFGAKLVGDFAKAISGILYRLKSILTNASVKKGEETKTYEPIAEAANTMLQELKLPFFLAITYTYSKSGVHDLKPNLILYSTSQPGMPYPEASYYLKKKVEHKAKEHHVAIIKVNTDPRLAPFTFGGKPFTVTLKDQPQCSTTSPPDGRDSCAQMISYVMEVHIRQHRCFLFTAFIQERYVCFMRWDCSGAIVSESHDWVENPEPLLMFFWCLAKCSDEERGYDSTATLVGDILPGRALTTELRKLEEKYKSNKWITKYIKEATKDTKKYSWVKDGERWQCKDTRYLTGIALQIVTQTDLGYDMTSSVSLSETCFSPPIASTPSAHQDSFDLP
ncbi:uncharacterized protein PHACADRAFT_202797 [Phanerochaete carnosa HHB-10118-sp]|uniref:Fungal-type protein kinase domain-containing protein n=1 Tax=Phanerochaete carnosa (strain HHB-10118-sp) TaxID=650164 RepID=K5WE60_PHACS|nr:uncharacterized protein PHACADRAFT_202797 [Phanerochaete carnosa HHB-10118-sp]EKM48452.1 hypothetical protein PHACADRAFT_202797 [Phanerochaete carnosa HHB-10118-sp]